MPKQISNHAHAAKLIRQELKRHGIKARVRAHTGSMTSSVDVDIHEDILPAVRNEIEAFVNQFVYGHFDGMDDSYRMTNVCDDLPQVKYAFVQVHYSDEIKAEARAFVESHYADLSDHEKETIVYRTLRASENPEFWRARKPRLVVREGIRRRIYH